MASPGEPATKHLREAETVAIMSRRRIDGFLFTDDRDAQALADHHGVIPMPFMKRKLRIRSAVKAG